MKRILHAIEVMIRAHQQAKSGNVCVECNTALRKYNDLPYAIHPIRVMRKVEHYITEWKEGSRFTDLTEDMLCISALHDVVEDTSYPIAQIEADFGKFVLDGVSWLTNVSKEFPRKSREERKAMDRERLAKAPDYIKCIKMWDRIDNLLDMIEGPTSFILNQYIPESLLLNEILRSADPAVGDKLIDAADWLKSITKGKIT